MNGKITGIMLHQLQHHEKGCNFEGLMRAIPMIAMTKLVIKASVKILREWLKAIRVKDPASKAPAKPSNILKNDNRKSRKLTANHCYEESAAFD